MKNQKPKTPARPHRTARQLLADARRSAVEQIKARPAWFALRMAACVGFTAVLVRQFMVNGTVEPMWVGLAVLFYVLTAMRLLRGMYGPAEQVRQWALEEQERITMMSLTGRTPDELQKLLDYHMKYGNIEEADRISQKLLLMVEKDAGGTGGAGGGASASVPAAPATSTNGEAEGLPGWLKDEEKQPAGENLPEWMK